MIKKILIGLTVLVQANIASNGTDISEYINENVLLVSINNEESLKFNNYKKNDFHKGYVLGIEDLTTSYEQEIKQGNYNKKHTFNRIYKLTIDTDKIDIDVAKRRISKLDFVEDVSYDYMGCAFETTVNDPYAGAQYAINNIGLNLAWDVEKGDSLVKVGIIDSGIDVTHPDLIGKVDLNLSKTYIASSNGTALEDKLGHGTHVAGIIGATPNDGGYVAGVCWDVTLVSLKILNTSNFYLDSNLAAAINYANSNNIKLLNASLGSYFYSNAVKNAIENYSGLYICSAGNDDNNNDKVKHYSSGYDLNNIICVGNCTTSGNKVSDSNYGKTTVDLFAPGENILSTYPMNMSSNGAEKLSGTSMAAPFVTGVAALVLSQNPNITAVQIKTRIMDNVDYVSALNDLCVTGGKLNANKAVRNSQHVHTNVIQQYDLSYHKRYCSPCGNVLYESHSWVEQSTSLLEVGYSTQAVATNYICTICNQTTSIKPDSII